MSDSVRHKTPGLRTVTKRRFFDILDRKRFETKRSEANEEGEETKGKQEIAGSVEQAAYKSSKFKAKSIYLTNVKQPPSRKQG